MESAFELLVVKLAHISNIVMNALEYIYLRQS